MSDAIFGAPERSPRHAAALPGMRDASGASHVATHGRSGRVRRRLLTVVTVTLPLMCLAAIGLELLSNDSNRFSLVFSTAGKVWQIFPKNSAGELGVYLELDMPQMPWPHWLT